MRQVSIQYSVGLDIKYGYMKKYKNISGNFTELILLLVSLYLFIILFPRYPKTRLVDFGY